MQQSFQQKMGTSFRQFPAASKKSCLSIIIRGLRGRLCGSGLVDTSLCQNINLAEPEALAVVQPPQGRTFQHLVFVAAIGQLVIIQTGVATVPAVLFHPSAPPHSTSFEMPDAVYNAHSVRRWAAPSCRQKAHNTRSSHFRRRWFRTGY